jgi:hypothetical protein
MESVFLEWKPLEIWAGVWKNQVKFLLKGRRITESQEVKKIRWKVQSHVEIYINKHIFGDKSSCLQT